MHSSENRVVITGFGVISPNGNNAESYWNSLLHGKSGIDKIDSFDTSQYSTKIAGNVRCFNYDNYIDHKQLKRMSGFTKLSVAASKMALRDANLNIENDNNLINNCYVIMGVSVNGIEIIEREINVMNAKGANKMSPFGVMAALPNAAASNIAIGLGLHGRTITISTGCSSALNAIGYAYELIKFNKTSTIICGGAESPITPSIMGAFCASNTLSKRNEEPEKASRPFENDRDGYILSEGAAVFVLESLTSALKRNAAIHAEIVGYGNTSDGYNYYKMEESGIQCANAMNAVINDAGIKHSEVNYISAHGSSSRAADIKETKAIKSVFGDKSKKLKISSIKSMIGHPLGAAGGLQLAATLLSGQHGYIHPTINYLKPDPYCDLDYVPNVAIRKQIKYAIINSFGMGGSNSSLLLKLKE